MITKELYDKELRPYFTFPGKFILFLLKKKWRVGLINYLEQLARGTSTKALHCEETYIPSQSTKGHNIRLRIFRPHNVKGKLPVLLYLHGGGYMIGNPEQYFRLYKNYIEKRPVIIIAPEYRKALKNPFPAGFNDCYDTLLWIKNNAESLKAIDHQFIVGGHSAGGGLTAAIALKARDTKEVKIAFQMPIYPMLDHRQQTESAKTMYGTPIWDSQTTKFAWSLYLRQLLDNQQAIPPYASPALNNVYDGLPPTISFVADLEPFRDETVAYIDALKAAGVPTKFKLFKEAFHGFEMVAHKTALAKAADTFQYEAFAEYYDKFF